MGLNVMPVNSERLHDDDWRFHKPDDSGIATTGRFVRILEVVERVRPAHVLDIGCGSGYLGAQIKTRQPGAVVDGVDISTVALERARARLDRVWHLDLDAAGLPAPAGVYDLVIASEVVEHLYDVQHAAAEIARVLKAGGHAVLTVPNLAYWRYRLDLLCGRLPLPADDSRHLHQFTAAHFAALGAANGLALAELFGHSTRLPVLARRWPAVFSDTLIALFRKPA